MPRGHEPQINSSLEHIWACRTCGVTFIQANEFIKINANEIERNVRGGRARIPFLLVVDSISILNSERYSIIVL